ncbi:hypothetical protein T310_5970 [Rasamsonia emersonii CBS 393.64]|uniref:Zinc finger CHCC-type domain-containing protein n=1 Tax=Rasamsonia emersonii (strain ATCC 16479 / CBS 393.64 / IMI 116815) TaxID=1408163 RepID=A0A0F4YP35_RASE3|nr:hypothetical protein T310_5970 [Rasamsonia emersonii CBS 393.64]KKA20027.1 hypothetical protein T310_5970 [Rasamsonia emersonii CBS 393.64]
MLSSARSRITALSARSSRLASRAGYSVSAPRWSENPVAVNDPTPKKPTSSISPSNAIPSDPMDAWSKPLQEDPEVGERLRQLQAPNRATTWAKSQQPRELAMTGPRFEQTIMEYQPRPYAAIELIHKQPVRWQKERVVACDGGGGPLGHPKIFINVDKPQIVYCTYCGLPYAHEQHREYLKSLPSTSYPLEPTDEAAEETQRLTEGAAEKR